MSSILSGIRNSSLSPGPNAATANIALNDQRLFEATPLSDSIDDALNTYVSPDSRPRRQAPSKVDFARPTIHAYDTLNQYATSGQWRSLALASESSILATPAIDTSSILKRWVYRIFALIRLGHNVQAEAELDRVESAGGTTVGWPFELRILRAQIPGLANDDWPMSIDRLSALLRGCQRSLGRSDVAEKKPLFEQRICRLNLLLVSCAMHMHDLCLASQILDDLLFTLNNQPPDPRLLSAIGRIYLQMGSIPEAESCFKQVENHVAVEDEMITMNRALFAVAGGRWENARDLFASIYAGHPERIAAGNNSAICELYLGSPQLMLNSLQQVMVALPAAAGTSEELVFNYCSGLDLHYDGNKLREAKIKKIIDVATWAGDGFDISSFKLQ
ncbi:hypothetical protein GGF39_002470 [Coemansia sp. RSA 1721]|nr:hypothetical protein GGF39_002470 [Coemansia sp. RSA 1721]